jgi:Trk K+ transport system NAD-binding subunit
VPSIKENKKLLQFLQKFEEKPISIVMANDDLAAKELYESGVDFVIYPHLLGGELLSDIIAKGALSKSMVLLRNRHLQTLNVE